jgi:hypothetical protein
MKSKASAPFVSAADYGSMTPACPHSLGAALALKEHPNSIRRCFKHGCAGRILHFAGPMEDRSGCRSDTHRCRVPTRHLWGHGKAARLRAAPTALLF